MKNIAYSDERRLYYQFSLPHVCLSKGWENVYYFNLCRSPTWGEVGWTCGKADRTHGGVEFLYWSFEVQQGNVVIQSLFVVLGMHTQMRHIWKGNLNWVGHAGGIRGNKKYEEGDPHHRVKGCSWRRGEESGVTCTSRAKRIIEITCHVWIVKRGWICRRNRLHVTLNAFVIGWSVTFVHFVPVDIFLIELSKNNFHFACVFRGAAFSRFDEVFNAVRSRQYPLVIDKRPAAEDLGLVPRLLEPSLPRPLLVRRGNRPANDPLVFLVPADSALKRTGLW